MLREGLENSDLHTREGKKRAQLSGLALMAAAAVWSLIAAIPALAEDADIEKRDGIQVHAGDVGRGEMDGNQARATLRYAKGFTLEYLPGCKIIHVLSPWRDAKVTFTYVLVPRGTRAPATVPGATVVEIPLRTVAVTTITCLPAFPLLGIEDRLVGVSGAERVSTPEVAQRIRSGTIVEIGTGATGMSRSLNMEMLHMLSPDAVLVNASGLPEQDKHPKLSEAGFTALIDAAYMEPTPLGRLEWIKFIAAFFDKEREAEAIFDKIAAEYETLAQRLEQVDVRPTVLAGTAYRGVFFVPGGDSYMARFLASAGADYIWKDDTHRASRPLSPETVFDMAKDAAYWLQSGPYRSLDDLVGADERNALLHAVRMGQVYSNDARTGPDGGNDYWETGIFRPDLVLADLAAIFHPELMPKHQLHWFRRLPAQFGESQ